VMVAVATMKFYPAEVAGRKVKQLARQPFTFAAGDSRLSPDVPDDRRSAAPDPSTRPKP